MFGRQSWHSKAATGETGSSAPPLETLGAGSSGAGECSGGWSTDRCRPCLLCPEWSDCADRSAACKSQSFQFRFLQARPHRKSRKSAAQTFGRMEIQDSSGQCEPDVSILCHQPFRSGNDLAVQASRSRQAENPGEKDPENRPRKILTVSA